MAPVEAVQHVRDPLYGYVDVTAAERRLIDTPEMQRLRRVGQLGMIPLVYPSGTHTRFAHSLGVMHLAGRFAGSLDLDPATVRAVRVAGLLHDVGHGPFSHTSERVARRYGRTHEQRSCRIVADLADRLPEGVDADRVRRHVRGEAPINIVAGPIDADRMDYLIRDSLFTGLEHGSVDVETLVKFARVADGTLAFERKCTDALKELLYARMHMRNAMSRHHATRLADAMVVRALDRYVDRHGVAAMLREDDYTMHTRLIEADGAAGDLYRRVADRDLYKRAYTLRGDDTPKPAMRAVTDPEPESIERRVAAAADLPDRAVVCVQPSLPEGDELDVTIDDGGDLKPFREVSAAPENIARERWRHLRFDLYAPGEHVADVAAVAPDTVADVAGIDPGTIDAAARAAGD